MGGQPCSVEHCTYISQQQSQYMHYFCDCRYADGSPVPGCAVKDANSPIAVLRPDGTTCYCCCSCFAFGTPIAISESQFKIIEEIRVGDEVMAAYANDRGLTWRKQQVCMSSGTGPTSHQPVMIYVGYGNDKHLIVTADHLFLMAEGKLKRADRLVPSQDQFVDDKGNAVPLTYLALGSFEGGVHHIATSLKPSKELDGHLLNSNGIVSADYALQIGYIAMDESTKDTLLVKNHDDLPIFGTQAYADAHSHLKINTNMAFSFANDHNKKLPNDFKSFANNRPRIPDHARTWISDKQATDIKKNAEIFPVSTALSKASIEYLFKLFGAFCPNIEFILDWPLEDPNTYSFIEYGKKFVIVSGALVRTKGLGIGGLSVILSHEVAHLQGSEPISNKGYSCEAQADAYGIGMILREVWFGELYGMMVPNGIGQIDALFSYISDENKKGDPDNTCEYPPIACRLESMRSAMMMLSLPPCAGGPKRLEVESAQAMDGVVVVSFNLPVNSQLAANESNYIIEPAADVERADVESDATKVDLKTSLKPGVSYTLTAQYIASADGAPLSLDKGTVEITVNGTL